MLLSTFHQEPMFMQDKRGLRTFSKIGFKMKTTHSSLNSFLIIQVALNEKMNTCKKLKLSLKHENSSHWISPWTCLHCSEFFCPRSGSLCPLALRPALIKCLHKACDTGNNFSLETSVATCIDGGAALSHKFKMLIIDQATTQHLLLDRRTAVSHMTPNAAPDRTRDPTRWLHYIFSIRTFRTGASGGYVTQRFLLRRLTWGWHCFRPQRWSWFKFLFRSACIKGHFAVSRHCIRPLCCRQPLCRQTQQVHHAGCPGLIWSKMIQPCSRRCQSPLLNMNNGRCSHREMELGKRPQKVQPPCWCPMPPWPEPKTSSNQCLSHPKPVPPVACTSVSLQVSWQSYGILYVPPQGCKVLRWTLLSLSKADESFWDPTIWISRAQ